MTINEEMNQIHTKYSCTKCGRKYPETLLNVEGHIHHHAETDCLDHKSCKRVQRKNKRKAS